MAMWLRCSARSKAFTTAHSRRQESLIEVIISDGTGALRVSFFNQPWLMNRFKQGDAISVSGKIDQYLGRIVMNSPDWEPVEMENLHTNRIVPIYPLTERITQKWLRKSNESSRYLLGARRGGCAA
jgi:ATP-dependent DNA helicase RecG